MLLEDRHACGLKMPTFCRVRNQQFSRILKNCPQYYTHIDIFLGLALLVLTDEISDPVSCNAGVVLALSCIDTIWVSIIRRFHIF